MQNHPPAWAAPGQARGPLLPIGGGYADTYAGFAEAVSAQAALTCMQTGMLSVVVLPTAYSSNPQRISADERARNLRDAEQRRLEIEAAVRRAAPEGLACCVTVAPIFTRGDAHDPVCFAPLAAGPAGVFMLGGDQAAAMAVLAGTPAEAALAAAYEAGAAIAGTSAGSGMLALQMLGGYNPTYGAHNSLDVGAVDIWNTSGCRGLVFGVPDVLVDQHFFQRGRLGRLLNAVTTPGAVASKPPTLGIGIDAYTGAHLRQGPAGYVLDDVFGLYEVAILDAGAYGAAEAVQYTPLEDPARGAVLSLRNVLVHLLAPGPFSFDLARRRASLAEPPPAVIRTFDALRLPPAAGRLILAGGLQGAVGTEAVLARFRQQVGSAAQPVLIYADGYESHAAACDVAHGVAARLRLPAEILTADDLAVCGPEDMGRGLFRPADYSGVVLLAADQSRVDVEALAAWLPALWRAGVPVLADDAAAAVCGAFYAAHGPVPHDGDAAEASAQRSFLRGQTIIRRGLGLVAATFEPQVLANNRWGRYFSLAYTHPEMIAVGLNCDAALELGPDGPWTVGENVALTLDLRAATLAAGANDGFVIANGLLDVFAPGDQVTAAPARLGEAPPHLTLGAQPAPVPGVLPCPNSHSRMG